MQEVLQLVGRARPRRRAPCASSPGLDRSSISPRTLRVVERGRARTHCQICDAGDLGGRGVLHQVVDRRRADAVQPRVEVADADRDVRAQPGLGDLARRVGDRRAAPPRPARRPRAAARAGSAARRARRRRPRSRPGRDRDARPRCRRSRRPTRAPCPRAPSRARRSFTSGSLRDGMNAAMPPIACAPRRWQVARAARCTRA